MIRNPKDELKGIQRLIKERIFKEDAFGHEVQGGVSDPRVRVQHGSRTAVNQVDDA